MTPVDIWAASACAVAGSALILRGNLLKPQVRSAVTAHTPVWLAINVLGIAMLAAAITIACGAPAAPREAVVYSALAVAAVVLLVNLTQQRPAERKSLAAAMASLIVHEAAGLERWIGKGRRTRGAR